MDEMSFFLGLAGLVSTLIASMLGLYYTNKARSATYQEFLYEKQVEIIVDYFDRINALKSLAGTLDINSKYSATKYSDRKQIWEEMQSKMISFYEIVQGIFCKSDLVFFGSRVPQNNGGTLEKQSSGKIISPPPTKRERHFFSGCSRFHLWGEF